VEYVSYVRFYFILSPWQYVFFNVFIASTTAGTATTITTEQKTYNTSPTPGNLF